MIDATATSASESSPVAQPEPVRVDRSERLLKRSVGSIAGWIAFTGGLVWFIYAGSVRVGAGHWLGQRLRVQVIWNRFLGFLADHGANAFMVGLVVLMAVLTLLGCLVLLWWVLGQRNCDTEPPVAPDAA